MKTKLILILVFFIIISCSNNYNTTSTIVSGQLQELKLKTIQIATNDSIFHSPVDNNGNFSFTIPIKTPQYIYAKELNKTLFLLPNDSLKINRADGKYIFKGGQSALINNYYADWSNYMNAVADTTDFEKYYNQKPSDFRKSVEQWIKIGEKPLNTLIKIHPNLNKAFIDCEKARIKYRMYSDLNNYKCKDEEIPNNFYAYTKNINLNDARLTQSDDYQYFLYSYLRMTIRRLQLNDKIKETSKMLDIIRGDFNKSIQNKLVKRIIREQILNLAVNNALLERFKLICTDSLYFKQIENTYKDLKSLSKGNKAPDFEFIDIKGNEISLDNFKGKYLLIDVWSTTCTPCIKEMPYLDKIKQENKGKNIEIIAVCLSDEVAWKKALRKYALKKGQYRVKNGWNSEFRYNYLKSSGVPVYILIDPNGVIIDARAPKPSENLKQLINSLNI